MKTKILWLFIPATFLSLFSASSKLNKADREFFREAIKPEMTTSMKYISMRFRLNRFEFTGVIDSRALYYYFEEKGFDEKKYENFILDKVNRKEAISIDRAHPIINRIHFLDYRKYLEMNKKSLKTLKREYFNDSYISSLSSTSNEYWLLIHILFKRSLLCITDCETGWLICNFNQK